MKIRFPERGMSGRSVVTVKNLEFGFGDEVNWHTLPNKEDAMGTLNFLFWIIICM